MADSRQFTDHNQVGGVNVFLEDKRLAERTAVGSAAGIANLKFLLANDDTEGFNTAIKAYIDEAVRSAIGTLVDNLDKNTAISRILATDANHDLGTITPANLANVLGALGYIKHVTYTTTLPGRNTWGLYPSASSEIQDQPFPWALYVSFGDLQIAFGTNQLSYRYYVDSWSQWIAIV